MPSPEDFLNELDEQKLVPESTIKLLSKKVQKSRTKVTVKALAKFLIETDALTQEQVDSIVASLPEMPSLDDSPALVEELKPSQEVEEVTLGDVEEGEASFSDNKPKNRRSTRHKHLKKSKGNEFDSPLILLGFGGLVVLVLVGLGLFYLLNTETGDERLRSAQEAYEAGSFSQAISEFETYVVDFPTHAGWSSAKVRLAIAKLRQAVDTGRNYAKGLEQAEKLIPQIEDEQAFNTAQGDLATLLPKIAEGLALQAEKASEEGDADATTLGVERTNAALNMVGNTKYVPKSLRDDIQIGLIGETLERIERRRIALVALQETLVSMEQANSSNVPRDAYVDYAKLIDNHPELVDEPKLIEALENTAQTEKSAIQFTPDSSEAVAEERPSNIFRAIAVANQGLEGTAETDGVYISVHAGIAYAVQASNGELLWRRPLGIGKTQVEPVPVGADYLLLDHRYNDLLRVNGITGKLIWRASTDPGSITPVVTDNRILVASESGRLLVFDTNSGQQAGYVEMAQPLRSPPTYDAKLNRIYLVGEHSSFYSLEASDLSCVGVYHLGHREGSVLLAPTKIGDKLAIIENIGFETASVRLLALDDEGTIAEELAVERLEGTCDTAPLVVGRRLAISTRLGEVRLYEISAAGSDREPMRELAVRPVGRQKPGSRYLAASKGGSVWIADLGLTRSVASLADSRLVVQRLDQTYTNDEFAGQIEARGNCLLHSRRQSRKPYITLAATNLDSGATIWETHVALSPVTAPIVSNSLKGLVIADQIGGLFLVNRDAIIQGVVSKPISQSRITSTLDNSLMLNNESILLTSKGRKRAVPINLSTTRQPRAFNLPGEISCEPEVMGEGWLAPLSIGQVLLLDAAGQPIATPFQPKLAPGQRIDWQRPGVGTIGGELHAVVPNSAGKLYCLRLNQSGSSSLEVVSSYDMQSLKPNSGASIVGEKAIFGIEGGLLGFASLPRVESVDTINIKGTILWGPHVVNDLVLLATDSEKLLGIDPANNKVAWEQSLENGLPVGKPLVEGNECMLSMERGTLQNIDPTTGTYGKSLFIGQNLAEGPTVYGKRLLLGTQDCAVLVVDRP